METLVFEQSSCWKYCMLVGEICGHRMTFILVKKKKKEKCTVPNSAALSNLAV